MIETRSASTALNKHKGLQQFFKWLLVVEEDIDRSPMERVRQPKTPKKPIPVMEDDDTRKVLSSCRGKEFIQLRDEAIIRLYYNTGARLSEVGRLALEDVDLTTESVHDHGKERGIAASASARRPRGRSAAICGLGPSTRLRICRTCGWPTAVSGRWPRTASRSCSSAAACRLG